MKRSSRSASGARPLAAGLVALALLPSAARPASTPPGPTPQSVIACPCDLPDWAVQSIGEVPSRVPQAVRTIRVRIANTGPGTSPTLVSKIEVWSQGDPFDSSDDFIQYTQNCGLIYVISHNGIPWSTGSLPVPPIASGAYFETSLLIPTAPGAWSVDINVLPMIQFINKYQQVVPLAECYTSPVQPPWPVSCVKVAPDWNNSGHWQSP